MILQKADAALTTGIEKMTTARKQLILESDTNVIPTRAIYYVSNHGSDESDGTTPASSWQTLDKVNDADLHPGDTVFFKRGDIFRGILKAKSGVTYSAYGKGHKPMLFTSPFNGAKTGKWLKTDAPDVYRFSEKIYDDVGCIIFDLGYAYATKATVDFSAKCNRTTGKKFESYHDLQEDLSFYHDLGGANLHGTEENSVLYLKSTMGAPDERFYDIEFGIRQNCVNVGNADNVHLNNLCIKYCGCHGVSAGSCAGLTVDYCEIGWIGGSVQYYRDGVPTRYGNGVEIYGSCTDYTVDHCYIHDIYDAGITHQFSKGGTADIVMKDIRYSSNIIENCVYSIEYFSGKADLDTARRSISHVRIHDNIMRFAGYGFGVQRPDKGPDAHIKSWDHQNLSKNVKIYNNIFQRSRHMMFHIAAEDEHSMPELSNNIILQMEGGSFGRLGAVPTTELDYTEEAVASQSYIGSDNSFYVL